MPGYRGLPIGTEGTDLPQPGGGYGGQFLGDLGLGALGGGFGNFFAGKQAGRNLENQFTFGAKQHELEHPNAAINAALTRNFRSNLLQNLQGLGGSGTVDPNQLFGSFWQSLRGGINPALQKEYSNLAGVPGLKFNGQYVGEDPTKMFHAKTPGFWESLGSGFAGALSKLPGIP